MDPISLAVFAPVAVPYLYKKFKVYKLAKIEKELRGPSALPASDNRTKIHANFLATQRLEKGIYGEEEIPTTECPCLDCVEYREGAAEREAKAAEIAAEIAAEVERKRQREKMRLAREARLRIEAANLEIERKKREAEQERQRLEKEAAAREQFRQAKLQYHRHHRGDDAEEVIVESDDGVVVKFNSKRSQA